MSILAIIDCFPSYVIYLLNIYFLNLIISEKFPSIIVLVFILLVALVFFFKGLLYLYWIFIHQLLLTTFKNLVLSF